MKQRRLTVLLGAMATMIAVRLWVPFSAPGVPAVEAIAKPAAAVRAPLPAGPPQPDSAAPTTGDRPAVPLALAGGSDAEDETAGNAFAVRHPPVPVAPSAPVQPVHEAVAPVAEPAPPDPAPPYQVIGTWDDGTTPGVFVATPNGVELARVGSSLGTVYKVTAISRQILTLEQITSKRQFQLAVPASASP